MELLECGEGLSGALREGINWLSDQSKWVELCGLYRGEIRETS